jgi:hypothetical protein
MANQVDYDFIYNKLKENNFDCSAVEEIRCAGEPASRHNHHKCLLGGNLVCIGDKRLAKVKRLKALYYKKSIQCKLKAILE